MTDAAADAWTLEIEAAILRAALGCVAETGWSPDLLVRAGKAVGLSRAEAELMFPNGAADLAALYWTQMGRQAMMAAADAPPVKVRDKIKAGVFAWLDALAAEAEASRRLLGYLALPWNYGLSAKLIWDAADQIWRFAGDTATDENHYSKRAIVSGILLAAAPMRLAEGQEIATAFVAARIDDVMAFEKWKAGVKPPFTAEDVAGHLARLRYGSR